MSKNEALKGRKNKKTKKQTTNDEIFFELKRPDIERKETRRARTRREEPALRRKRTRLPFPTT